MESRDSDLRKDSDLEMMNNSKNHNGGDQTVGSSHLYTVDHTIGYQNLSNCPHII